MARIALVSASDAKFFYLLEDLLASIKDGAKRDGFDVAVLDVGLTNDQRATLERGGVAVIEPVLDYDVSFFKTAPEPFFRSMTARPHLPHHLPGYDVYVFLDADTWVQDWEAVRLYVSSAMAKGLAITPEVDRSYGVLFDPVTVAEWRLKTFQRCFDEKVARNLAVFPMINSGIFAARADTPLWEKWSNLLGHLYKAIGEPFFFAEQAAMNALIRSEAVSAALLPSRCNWMCNRAAPVTRDGTIFCEPQPPYAPLGIIHLTGPDKDRVVELVDLDGSKRARTLRFPKAKV